MKSYYLYSQKRTKTIAEITVSVFQLAFVPIPGSVTVEIDTISYTKFFTQGNELHLVHSNPEELEAYHLQQYADATERPWVEHGFFGSPDIDIEVAYDYVEWSTNTFNTSSNTENLTIRDDEYDRYYKIFEESPVAGETYWRDSDQQLPDSSFVRFAPRYGPVVVTDDWVERTDQREYQNEFSVDPITGEVVFSPDENLIRNPGFIQQHPSTGAAIEWNDLSTGTVTPDSAQGTTRPVYGSRMVSLSAGEGIRQTVRMRERALHNVSFYVNLPSDAGPVKLVVNPIDVAGDYRNQANTATGAAYNANVEIMTKLWVVTAGSWQRLHAVIGTSDQTFAAHGALLGELPASAVSLEIRVELPSDAGLIDAVQLHGGPYKAPFLGLPGKATIEYEGNNRGVYTPGDSTEGFARDLVNLNPLTAQKPNGFLCWVREQFDSTDFQLGKGGDLITRAGVADQNILGRKHVPYAQTSGLAKLAQRWKFHFLGSVQDHDLPDRGSVLVADQIEPLYPENSYHHFSTEEIHTVDKVGATIPFSVLVYDQFGNPLVDADVAISVTAASPISTSVVTNSAGRARYVHTVQGTTGIGAETITFSINSLSQLFKVDVQ